MAAVSVALAALALIVAWVIFRLERFASRRREIAGARAALVAVQRGMIEGMPELGSDYRGWGEVYFTTVYSLQEAMRRGQESSEAIQKRGWDQVFVVPTEPLAHLATTTSDLISEETIFAANFGLWRVEVFNQLVLKQSAFNVRHAVEIVDPGTPRERRQALANAAHEISAYLHHDGIGGAGTDEGWYGRLKRAVAADVARLRQMERERLLTYGSGERYLIVPDLLVALVAAGVLIFGGFAVARAIDGDTSDRGPRDSTRSETLRPQPALRGVPQGPPTTRPQRTATRSAP
jgi:hypothetical protein